ncbi:hypothetical protein VTL71DRAFT_4793 [Oculimacula yallundae]|uniref:Uncharacterized protein n=1 Tax=Oculimacula yallundae TaxID=86028 RepID=A0ABR4C321_9HELO
MYEALLGKIDTLASSLGLGRASHRVLPGENPWGYAGGDEAPSTENENEGKRECVLDDFENQKGAWGEDSARSSTTTFVGGEKGDRAGH